jgi:hypothetical protein
MREPRERSLDRDFMGPGGGYGGGTMGGPYGRRDRSLERGMLDHDDGLFSRDPMGGGRLGTRLSPNPMGPGLGPRGDPYMTVTELQHSNSELQRDLANLKKELEVTNQKLGSSMHSIKTFWSPELKKERALRKEESAKYSLINDQLKLLNSENQVNVNCNTSYNHVAQPKLSMLAEMKVKELWKFKQTPTFAPGLKSLSFFLITFCYQSAFLG